MTKYCAKCSNKIPEGRLKIFPNITTCITCSSVEKVHGIPITVGTGDNTYNDIVILSDDEYKVYTNVIEPEEIDNVELIDMDKEEIILTKEQLNALKEGLEEEEMDETLLEIIKAPQAKKRKLKKI